jgi:signal peptidase I
MPIPSSLSELAHPTLAGFAAGGLMRRRILVFGLLAIAAALAVAAARRLVAYEISDRSMEPALRNGDWVLGTRQPRLVRRGHVVVFAHPMRPGFDIVKRVAAVAGEEVGRVTLGRGEVWATRRQPRCRQRRQPRPGADPT